MQSPLPNRLKNARKLANMTQEQLSTKLIVHMVQLVLVSMKLASMRLIILWQSVWRMCLGFRLRICTAMMKP